MAKQIVHGEDSRQAILRGVNILANAVKITTEALIAETPGQEHADAMPGAGGSGMY